MRFLQRALDKMLASQEDFSKFSVRAFMELVVFRINGRFKAECDRLKGISDEMVRARAKVYLLQELAYTGMAVLVFFVEVGVVIQQAGKILAGESTVGTLVALAWFIQSVFWPVIGMGHAWLRYKMDALAYSHLDQVLALPDDPGLQGGLPLNISSGRITFDHVTFAYAEQEVLNDFHMEIEAGKTTAFVGASGGGKSTLLRLLLHLVRPQRGKVLVDGQDLFRVHLATYYEQVAYVPQEPPIFDGTLRENLSFNRPVPAQRLAEVLRLVGLDGLVGRLPNGLETLVGERGIKLSGGERQRLAFGRIMLQDPKIIILDEATASLDSLTEAWVTKNLMNFLRGKTIIIVAHRLQTVRDADQIIVLQEGAIVQRGNFAGLLSQPGPFLNMWEKQAQENG
jgi:ATP-binding cassette subfamily B protein